MLVDPKFIKIDDCLTAILGMIGGTDPAPRRLGAGLYEIGHFNFDLHLQDVGFGRADGHAKWLAWPELDDFVCHGVCDSPDQFLAHALGLSVTGSDRRFAVAFSKVLRNEQGEGGWRWHKWGPYIGSRSPRCEYLADEPEIQEVYVFHIFECIDRQSCIEGARGSAEIMTLEDWVDAVRAGEIIPNDGFGYPVIDGRVDESQRVEAELFCPVPAGASHVVWHNS